MPGDCGDCTGLCQGIVVIVLDYAGGLWGLYWTVPGDCGDCTGLCQGIVVIVLDCAGVLCW